MIKEPVDRFLVDRLKVIHLEKRVDQNLHVALDLVRSAFHEIQLVEPVLFQFGSHRPQVGAKVFRLGILVDENQFADILAAQLLERVT